MRNNTRWMCATALLVGSVMMNVQMTPAEALTREPMTEAAESEMTETTGTDFTAVVTSDFHYQIDAQATTLLPAAAYCREFMEVFTDQVIDLKPDAWIITGDNTNSGKVQEEKELQQILQKAADAGIAVILTTGNHDFDASDADTFAESFAPLLTDFQGEHGGWELVSQDEASLSYEVELGDVTVFALDEESGTNGEKAVFNEKTLQWLETELIRAQEKGQKILTASHRSVLTELVKNDDGDYRINNPRLEGMLEKYGVQLALSGHQHTQNILASTATLADVNREVKGDGSAPAMYEIISDIPLGGQHRFGVLKIKGDEVSYEAQRIDFAAYGSEEFTASMIQVDKQQGANTELTIDNILSHLPEDAPDAEQVRALISSFFQYYGAGVIGEHVEDIVGSRYWESMKEAIEQTNYGAWIEAMMENPPLNAVKLNFYWE